MIVDFNKNTPSSESLQLAGQAWCKPSTEHLVMIPELATVFAAMIDEIRKDQHYAQQLASM